MCERNAVVKSTLALALVASVAACKFDPPADVEFDASTIDAAMVDAETVDSMIDAMPPDAMLDPAMLDSITTGHDFGDVTVDGTSATLAIIVRNIGDLPTGTLDVTLAGDHPGDFAIVPTGGADDCDGITLAAEETCTTQVRFEPAMAGARTALVEISATPGGTLSIPVDGNGLTAGDLEITAGGTLTFGAVEITTQSAFQTVTVTNTGQTTTGNLTVTLGDTTNYAKGTDTCNGAPLAPAATCSVQVRFTPTLVGSLPTSISIRESPTVGVSASASGSGSARLAITKSGTGTIASIPAGISCGTGCTSQEISFTQTPVNLTATAGSGFAFDGWTGACASANPLTMCTVSLTEPLTTAGAAFVQVFTMDVTTSGSGVVTSAPAGISCGNGNTDCTHDYETGTVVTLTADPDPGWEVFAWTGATCTAGQQSCMVTMNQARTIGVEFRRQYTLTVSTSGTGSGTVTGSGINCPGTCSATVFDGTAVTLTQTPASATSGTQNVFTGWGGACTGTGACSFTMSANATVTAGFKLQHQLSVTMGGTGAGTVTGTGGFSCSTGTCTQWYDSGTAVTLTPTPGASSLFDSFSGSCTGATCSLTMSAPRTVTATFNAGQTMNVTVSGTGTVTSTPAGITCGDGNTDCSELFVANSMVTLTADPDPGWEVYSWAGTGATCNALAHTCVVTMSQARNVTVTFRQRYTLTVSTSGTGTVTSSVGGINCPGTCSATYFDGDAVTLTASPGAAGTGSRNIFSAWSGACTGSNTTCALTMDAAKSTSAAFQLQHQLTVSIANTNGGSGTVTATGGLDCPGTCSVYYNANSNVTLTATSGASTHFDGFSGACSTGTCAMTAPVTTTATFRGWSCIPDQIVCDNQAEHYTDCGPTGLIEFEMDCPLGCATDPTEKCLDVDPSNGLASYLDMAPNGPDLSFPAGGTHQINTDTGSICINGSCSVYPSALVGNVRVFWLDSLVIDGTVDVDGTPALALVVDGDVSIVGTLDVSAEGAVDGPGRATVANCDGGNYAGGAPTGGGGGAGHAQLGRYGGPSGSGTAGGAGGTIFSNPDLVPLEGGCRGGYSQVNAAVRSAGGGAGGAVQIVSRTTISLTGTGKIDASGGGGGSTATLSGTSMGGGGGGSGGGVLLEAPQVTLNGADVVISTKGGGGGAGGTGEPSHFGQDGGVDAAPAAGGSGGGFASGGAGGIFGTYPTTGGSLNGSGGGGGGGAVGEIRFNTRSGVVSPQGGAAIHSYQSSAQLIGREVP